MALKKFEVTLPDGSTYEDEFDDSLSEEEIIAQIEKPAGAPDINKGAEGVRKFAQGLTFGFGDEIEAKIRQAGSRAADLFGPNNEGATTSADYYKTVRDSLRAKGDEFSRQNPKSALALELAGGLVLPGGVVGTGAKAGVKAGQILAPRTLPGVLASGTGQGAAYGVGTARDNESLLGAGLEGAAFGLGGTALMRGGAGLVAPKLAPDAQALRDKGIQLTPGQAYGGLTNKIEETLSNVYGNINTRRNEGLFQFNEKLVDDILKPLGKKSIKSDDMQEVVAAADRSLGEVYDTILPNLKLSGYPGLKNKFSAAADDIGLEAEFKKQYNKKVSDIIQRIKKDANRDPGTVLKNIQSELSSESFSLMQGGVGAAQTYGKALRQLKNKFDDELVAQNPKFAPDLKKANDAFRRLIPLNDVSKKLPVDSGIAMTPNQIKRAAVTSDKSAKPGEALLQREAKEAATLGNVVPDSGTALRSLVLGGGSSLATGTGVATGAITIPAAMAFAAPYFAYSKPAMNAFNKFISKKSRTREEIAEYIRKNATGLGGRTTNITAEGLL